MELATRALGEKIKDMGYGTGIYPSKGIVAVKVPVFSFEKLPMVEVSLGPEMKSTGEVLGLERDLPKALYKGLIAAGYGFSKKGSVLITVADNFKHEVVPIAENLLKPAFIYLPPRVRQVS